VALFCFRPEGYVRNWVNDDSTRYEYLLSLNGVHGKGAAEVERQLKPSS
jgi:hypothetical protein